MKPNLGSGLAALVFLGAICLGFELIFGLRHFGTEGGRFSLSDLTLVRFRELITASALLLGMLMKYVYDYLTRVERQSERFSPIKFLQSISSDPTFYKTIIVAPIVYYGTFFFGDQSLLEKNPVIILYAFQNGFFWKAILEGSERPKSID